MVAAALPADEEIRLRTLQAYNVLDTPADPNFDRLVALAADHFGVPIVVLSLIDGDRQWFKATFGTHLCYAPREPTFYAHAILQPGKILIVENALRDPRFHDNPFVIGPPFVRFYAGVPILAENGQPLGTLCIIDEKPRQLDLAGQAFLANLAATAGAMLELHSKNRTLYTVANQDWLTGVCNRRGFEVALDAALQGPSEPNCALMLLDLDGFKGINDTFGHDAGDALLREVAIRLCANARPTDLVTRLGGDEFAVLIDGPLDLDSARNVAIRYVTALVRHYTFLGHPVPIGASVGIAVAPFHGLSAEKLIRAADQALYHAKRTSSQIAMPGGDGLETPAILPRQIDSTLQSAVVSGDLSISWQLFYSLRRAEISGRKAIAHWNNTAERRASEKALDRKPGLTVTPGTWLLEFACERAAKWQDGLPVVVNISTDWLTTSDLTAMVRDVLARHGISPERLILQVSEQSLGFARELVLDRMTALQNFGVSFVLSDFGIGHGSLMHIQHLPVDILKPDERFVAELGKSTKAAAIAKYLIELCHELDIRVCATGVENAEQLAFLRAAKCDYAQGEFLDAQLLLPLIDPPLLHVA